MDSSSLLGAMMVEALLRQGGSETTVQGPAPRQFHRVLRPTGADLLAGGIEEPSRRTPLHRLLRKRCKTAVVAGRLTDHPEEIEALTRHNVTALWFAVKTRSLADVRLLLERGARVFTSVHTTNGNTVLHLAATGNEPLILEALLDAAAAHGVPEMVSVRNKRGLAPLHCATIRNASAAMMVLLQRGASPDAASQETGWCPVHFAARAGHTAATLVLMAARANLNVQTTVDGWTPLIIAVSHGQCDVASLLATGGADLSLRDRGGGAAADRVRGARMQYLFENLVHRREGAPAPPIALSASSEH